MGRQSEGFTLMEIILVIMILGFMVGMVVPFAGQMDEQTRIKKTRESMETIRAALVGPRGRFDDKGRPVLEGYVGDVGHLPELYAVHWDKTFGENGGWVYNGTGVTQDANATFEPAVPTGLWSDVLSPLAGTYDSADIPKQETWNGPYMFKPYDERDNQIFDYDEYSDTWENKELFESFETDGRLADAWGRNLAVYYTKKDGDHPGDMYFVSRGPDGKWDESPGVLPHDPTGVGNRDNIVLSVNSNEWESIIEDMKSRTRERLQEIRKALVGDAPVGTNYGYTGHTCRWPDLYNWDNATQEWTNSTGGSVYSIGQPRGLWNWDIISGMTPDWSNPGMTPFFSRYLQPPGYDADELEEDKLTDAWGEEIYLFRDSDNSTVLILSKGPDRKFDFQHHVDTSNFEPDDLTGNTHNVKIKEQYFEYSSSNSFNDDNIVKWIHKSDWINGTVFIEFVVTNINDNSTKASLYYDFETDPLTRDNSTDGPSAYNATSHIWNGTYSLQNATTGPRYILFWHDNGNNSWNSTEDNGTLISVDVRKQSEAKDIRVDAKAFEPNCSLPR